MTYKLCIVSASKRNPKHLPSTEHTNQCRNLYYCLSLHIGKKISYFGKIFINSDSYCNSWVCYARWRFAYNKMAARTPSIVVALNHNWCQKNNTAREDLWICLRGGAESFSARATFENMTNWPNRLWKDILGRNREISSTPLDKSMSDFG